MKCLEAQHVFGNPFDKPVIMLKDVVEILNLQGFNHLAMPRYFQYFCLQLVLRPDWLSFYQ